MSTLPSGPPNGAPRPILALLAAGLLLTAMTLAFLRPTPERMASSFLPDRGDPLFNLYVLSWGVHQLELGLPSFWDANIFYPTPKALTLSDHLIGPALFGWALSPLVPSPIVVYNLLVLGSFVLTGLAAFWVLRRSGASFAAALLAAAGYAFSPFRWTHLNHIQVLLMACIPLVLWSFDRLLAERTWRRALVFLAVYLLHLSGGAYLAYMIHFPLLAILVSRAIVEGRKLWTERNLALLAGVAGIALAADLALFLPYHRGQAAMEVTHEVKEVRRLGADPFSYITPSVRNVYATPILEALEKIRRPAREATLFPGFFTSLAAAIGLFAWARSVRRKREDEGGARASDPWLRGLAWGGAFTCLLSFPIVFEPLARLLPGMAGMRSPSRFYAFTGFALAAFAARGFDRLLARRESWRTALIALACALALAEAIPVDFRWMRIPTRAEQPPVYAWLAGRSDVHALLELPMKVGTAETPYMWAATVHWKPIVNGYSGFLPAPYPEIAAICRPLPDGPAIERLRQLGVTHLVIHTQDERARPMRRMLPEWSREHEGRDLERVYDDGVERVERIVAGATATPLRIPPSAPVR